MRKYLLPQEGNDYKANLHCHTYLSDGKCTPEEVKESYSKQGYSIVAFTDHDVHIPHDELTDENFLALHGCEIEVNENDDLLWREMKTMHMNCIAIEPDNHYQVCYHRSKYLYANSVNQRAALTVDESKPDFIRVHSHEGVSKMMKEARDSGFFVTYNHPHGNLENYPDYIGYKNMHAMEIFNAGDFGGHYGFMGVAPDVYDNLLRAGNKICCVAGDDNHKADGPNYFKGYTVIRADKLEYRTVTQALLDGNFYVSMGPVIDSLYVEDGVLHITTPGVSKIAFNIGNRRENKLYCAAEGELLKEAEYALKPDQSYIRVTLFDEKNNPAFTNAYFIDDLLMEEK